MIEFFPSREVALEIGNLSVRWYGLLYVIAFWLGWWMLPTLAALRGILMSRDQASRITLWVVLGVIVGGRLGYVVLYEPSYYWLHPAEIFSLTHGGMSFHGGFLGVGLIIWWLTQTMKLHWLQIVDLLVVPIAFGLALGRIGNFINQELYSGYWAMIVAGGDALLAGMCWYGLSRSSTKVGGVTALFLVGYGMIRFFSELVRIDDWSYLWGFTYGQFLTIPILVLGIYLWTKKIPISE